MPQGTLAGLELQTIFGKVTAQIEFLHIGADGYTAAQAFRFLGMDDSCAERLKAAIDRMQCAGYSDAEFEENDLTTLASVRDHIRSFFQAGFLRAVAEDFGVAEVVSGNRKYANTAADDAA